MKEFKSELYLAKREIVNWKILKKNNIEIKIKAYGESVQAYCEVSHI